MLLAFVQADLHPVAGASAPLRTSLPPGNRSLHRNPSGNRAGSQRIKKGRDAQPTPVPYETGVSQPFPNRFPPPPRHRSRVLASRIAENDVSAAATFVEVVELSSVTDVMLSGAS
jgi:hypothetical protein